MATSSSCMSRRNLTILSWMLLPSLPLLVVVAEVMTASANCQEEAHDEPWGRCPGMRSMRKWLFGWQSVVRNSTVFDKVQDLLLANKYN